MPRTTAPCLAAICFFLSSRASTSSLPGSHLFFLCFFCFLDHLFLLSFGAQQGKSEKTFFSDLPPCLAGICFFFVFFVFCLGERRQIRKNVTGVFDQANDRPLPGSHLKGNKQVTATETTRRSDTHRKKRKERSETLPTKNKAIGGHQATTKTKRAIGNQPTTKESDRKPNNQTKKRRRPTNKHQERSETNQRKKNMGGNQPKSAKTHTHKYKETIQDRRTSPLGPACLPAGLSAAHHNTMEIHTCDSFFFVELNCTAWVLQLSQRSP